MFSLFEYKSYSLSLSLSQIIIFSFIAIRFKINQSGDF